MSYTTDLITDLGTHAVPKNVDLEIVVEILNQELVSGTLTDVAVDVEGNGDTVELHLGDRAGVYSYTAVGAYEVSSNPDGSKVRFTIPDDAFSWQVKWWEEVEMVGAVRRLVAATGKQDEHGQMTLVFKATPGVAVAA